MQVNPRGKLQVAEQWIKMWVLLRTFAKLEIVRYCKAWNCQILRRIAVVELHKDTKTERKILFSPLLLPTLCPHTWPSDSSSMQMPFMDVSSIIPQFPLNRSHLMAVNRFWKFRGRAPTARPRIRFRAVVRTDVLHHHTKFQLNRIRTWGCDSIWTYHGHTTTVPPREN